MQPPEPGKQAGAKRHPLHNVSNEQAGNPRETKAPKPAPAVPSKPLPPSLHEVLAQMNSAQQQYEIRAGLYATSEGKDEYEFAAPKFELQLWVLHADRWASVASLSDEDLEKLSEKGWHGPEWDQSAIYSFSWLRSDTSRLLQGLHVAVKCLDTFTGDAATTRRRLFFGAKVNGGGEVSTLTKSTKRSIAAWTTNATVRNELRHLSIELLGLNVQLSCDGVGRGALAGPHAPRPRVDRQGPKLLTKRSGLVFVRRQTASLDGLQMQLMGAIDPVLGRKLEGWASGRNQSPLLLPRRTMPAPAASRAADGSSDAPATAASSTGAMVTTSSSAAASAAASSLAILPGAPAAASSCLAAPAAAASTVASAAAAPAAATAASSAAVPAASSYAAVTAGADGGSWECVKCTYAHVGAEAGFLSCAVCRKERPRPPPPPPPPKKVVRQAKLRRAPAGARPAAAMSAAASIAGPAAASTAPATTAASSTAAPTVTTASFAAAPVSSAAAVAVGASADGGSWECIKCTYAHVGAEAGFLSCAVCRKERPRPPPPPPPPKKEVVQAKLVFMQR